MVHEQLMTQKIIPKNSPEQGVDLSRKEGTDKASLPLPISLARLQELRAHSCAVLRTASTPLCSCTSPCHLTQGGNETVKRERAQHSPLLPIPSLYPSPPKSTLGNYIVH